MSSRRVSRHPMSFVWALVFVAAFRSTATQGQEVKVYFGNLHAHSNASDGNKNTTPAEAYQIAREQGKLDFLSLSEHNHIMENQGVYDGVMAAADAATSAGFVALYGQEFSTIKKGHNHANIQNYPVRIDPQLNGKYRKVFEDEVPQFLTANPGTIVVGEFNHPRTSEDIGEDYGLKADFGGDWNAFRQTMDPIVKLIAVASGPADANKKNFVPSQAERFMHQNISQPLIDRWFTYLGHGLHLAPKIDHDSHSPTYGFRHAGRTAVWAKGDLTKESLLKALSDRHCYATEDLNLRIVPKMDGDRMPGDILTDVGDGTVKIDLSINDTDEANANYTIEVFAGTSGDGQLPKEVVPLETSRSGNGPVSLELQGEKDQSLYYVIHVAQRSTDPINGSKTDDVWLSPIWIGNEDDDHGDDEVDGVVEFVSSKNSEVYHFANCRFAKKIKEKNLVHHETAPANKRLHQGCPVE